MRGRLLSPPVLLGQLLDQDAPALRANPCLAMSGQTIWHDWDPFHRC